MSIKDTYKEVKTFEFSNMVARVYIPELTAEERSRRMQKVRTSAARLMKEELSK